MNKGDIHTDMQTVRLNLPFSALAFSPQIIVQNKTNKFCALSRWLHECCFEIPSFDCLEWTHCGSVGLNGNLNTALHEGHPLIYILREFMSSWWHKSDDKATCSHLFKWHVDFKDDKCQLVLFSQKVAFMNWWCRLSYKSWSWLEKKDVSTSPPVLREVHSSRQYMLKSTFPILYQVDLSR